MEPLLDTAPCSLLAFDDSGRIVAANETLSKLLSYRPGELLGRPISDILTRPNRIFYQTHFFPLMRLHGRADEVYLSLLTANGEEVPVLVNAVRKEQGEGYLNHCAMMPVYQRQKYVDEILLAKRAAEDALRNNDELLRAKRESEKSAQELDRQLSRLEQKNQELARVSQVLSHDLREPIRKIAWFAEMLDAGREAGPAAGGDEWLEKIGLACQRADRLLHVLREFVSLDLGEETVERVDLNDVVAAALLQVNRPAEAIRLHLESEQLPVVDGFRRQLKLLFRNLLQDARALRPADSLPHVSITVSTVEHNSFRMMPGRYRYERFVRIVLHTSRSGRGEDAAALFEPLGEARKHSSEFDFSMATCRKVVDNHRGQIAAAFDGEEGTVFTVLLPLRQ